MADGTVIMLKSWFVALLSVNKTNVNLVILIYFKRDFVTEP